MSQTVEHLLVDLVSWVASQDRAYDEVMAAWRTSCPRLPVWEEANERGLVIRTHAPDGTAIIRITEAGRAFLHEHAA